MGLSAVTGPWMDTNLVLPLSGKAVDRCKVVFDYWLDADALQQAAASFDSGNSGSSSSSSGGGGGEHGQGGFDVGFRAAVQAALQSQFVQESLASSHQVQVRPSLDDLSCAAGSYYGFELNRI